MQDEEQKLDEEIKEGFSRADNDEDEEEEEEEDEEEEVLGSE